MREVITWNSMEATVAMQSDLPKNEGLMVRVGDELYIGVYDGNNFECYFPVTDHIIPTCQIEWWVPLPEGPKV